MGGMVGHIAPVSTVSLAPIACAISGRLCIFNGFNGTFNVTTGESLAWMSHAGGWLECADGTTGLVRAVPRSASRVTDPSLAVIQVTTHPRASSRRETATWLSNLGFTTAAGTA
jgi:hypothetical protein